MLLRSTCSPPNDRHFMTHQIASINTILLLACCAITCHRTATENIVGLVPRLPTSGFFELVCCSCGNTWTAPSDVEAQEAQGPAAKRSVCKGKQSGHCTHCRDEHLAACADQSV